MMTLSLDMAQTAAVAAVLLVIGDFIRGRVPLLSRYFIPGPIIGGLLFSLLALAGHQSGAFAFQFDAGIRDFLLLAFFTTIGFSASFEMLKKGGVGVALFLGAAVGLVLVLLQNVVGVGLAAALGVHPLIGLAAGSVSLTGGLGTSAAFGPLMEQAGAAGALPAAIAAATWGLVTGSIIGGPVGSVLLRRHGLSGARRAGEAQAMEKDEATAAAVLATSAPEPEDGAERTALHAIVLLALAMGLGTVLVNGLRDVGVVIPAYLGPMLVAALLRNLIDWRRGTLPEREFEQVGNVALAFFLAMALMSMRLWEMAEVAGPLLVILIAQTALMFAFAYFITFRVMGRDYDAAVISAGHCGFGLGATPNAMANMQAFATANGPSVKAFFVIPLVGSLFIDFFNAVIITGFMGALR